MTKWVNKMDSIKCQALLLAIQHGSLTAAAKELGYTQSGITRMIQSLEEEIGFPLLVPVSYTHLTLPTIA